MGLGFQIRILTPTSYGSRGTAHAHCQFFDFRLKLSSISETVRDSYVHGSYGTLIRSQVAERSMSVPMTLSDP